MGKDAQHKNIPEFRPNSSPELIKVDTMPIPGAHHRFSVGFDGIDEISDQLSSVAEVISASTYGIHAPATLQDSCRRFGRFMLAKKLATAVDEDARGSFYVAFSPIIKEEFEVPQPMRTFVDGYGCFTLNQARFTPLTCQLLVTTAFAHAVGSNADDPEYPQQPASNHIFAFKSLNWKQDVLDNAAHAVAAFANSTTRTVNVGGMDMRIPHISSGFAAFRALPGLNLSAELDRLLQLAALVEANMNVAAYPTAADKPALQALGLTVLDWNKTMMSQLIVKFRRQHVNYLNGYFGKKFTLDKVTSMTNEGKPWQLLNVVGDLGTCLFDIPSEDKVMGMIGSNRSTVIVEQVGVNVHTDVSASVRSKRFISSFEKRGI